MQDGSLHVGKTPVLRWSGKIAGDYVMLDSERFYRISEYDQMEPFFISLVSSSNLWAFLSSKGGLTAGRQDSGSALFPYYTEDKIHDNSHNTGSRTILRVGTSGRRYLWEPFSDVSRAVYQVSRNLYKNLSGDKLVYEEVNRDLGLVFRYSWLMSDRFGLVKRSELESCGQGSTAVEVLDGIENLLPWGVAEYFQNFFSCLGDAYKQNELDKSNGLATYSYSSIPGDSTDPAEALRTTVCWSTCSPSARRLLSSLQLDEFRRGGGLREERRVCGRRGAYFIQDNLHLEPGEREDWLLIADVNFGLSQIAQLRRAFAGQSELKGLVLDDVRACTENLVEIVASADGLQKTGDSLGSAHHFSNVLFNVMRGGIFESGYSIPLSDLSVFLRAFSKETYARHAELLDAMGRDPDLHELLEEVRSLDDPDLTRLVFEYLPLSFSRRHGDPSRPWNKFTIRVKGEDGSRLLNFEGNWRDIFQNWEALALSFPEYIESIICKFVNSTTIDGYNPYRITKDGYEWEVPSPDEPWANIGYWGDHQLIYLLKFLEMSRRYHPGALEALLREAIFVYADIPYEIKPYDSLLEDPRDSITYSTRREEEIAARERSVGHDGKYAVDRSGSLCRANLTEKLLVPLLAKVANFIPGAGFWMNTQRPEWNDANNALAGYGVSMVTLYYARRYLLFCRSLFEAVEFTEVEINTDVLLWLEDTNDALEAHRALLSRDVTGDADRKALLDDLGWAAERYRARVYQTRFSGERTGLTTEDLQAFLDLMLAFVDQTIQSNCRADGLYHAYKVLAVAPSGVSVKDLQAMLEGQVSVLSSGFLSPQACVSLVKALRSSELYRADQHSYLLYPDRQLPAFVDKNCIPADLAEKSRLIGKLIADSNTDLVEQDIAGGYHFNPSFQNVRDVLEALNSLAGAGYGDLVRQERDSICGIFESVFRHEEFTGRSGTFYGYEGLGCIYWHMVSKLLLAVQENCLRAHTEEPEAFTELAELYYEVRAGIGFNKSPEEYGAFPTDPYSHTPGFSGAKQPGMTGQVKEEVITRLGELGVRVDQGTIRFDPCLLRDREFVAGPCSFEFYDVHGNEQSIELTAGTLAFTYCQVPIVYHRRDTPSISIRLSDGVSQEIDGDSIDADTSREIFRRTGRVGRLDVYLRPGLEESRGLPEHFES